MDRFNSSSKTSYIYTTNKMSAASTTSMEKGSGSECRTRNCSRVLVKAGFCGGGGLLALIIMGVVLGSVFYFGGMYQQYQDLEPCFDINLGKSLVGKIDNVSFAQGERVEVDCKVINYNLKGFQEQKVYWTGPNFTAEARPGANTKIIKDLAGVTVIAKESKDFFQCADYLPLNGTVDVKVLIFKLIVFTNGASEGWWTCSTNYSIPVGDRHAHYVSSEKFYLGPA